MKAVLILSPEIKPSRDPDNQWKNELLTCFLLFWTHLSLAAYSQPSLCDVKYS